MISVRSKPTLIIEVSTRPTVPLSTPGGSRGTSLSPQEGNFGHSEFDPSKLPHKKLKIDVAMECFRSFHLVRSSLTSLLVRIGCKKFFWMFPP